MAKSKNSEGSDQLGTEQIVKLNAALASAKSKGQEIGALSIAEITSVLNYTRMTNFTAYTIAASYGAVIGKPQTADLRRSTKASMDAFFANLQAQGMIGNVNAPTQPGWSVQIDANNNPFAQVAEGYMQANVAVTYANQTFCRRHASTASSAMPVPTSASCADIACQRSISSPLTAIQYLSRRAICRSRA